MCASRQDMVWWTKSKFLGLLPKSSKDQIECDCEISNYYLALPIEIYSSLLEYPDFFERVVCKMFWTLLGYTVTKKKHALSQEILVGSQDCFYPHERMGSKDKANCHHTLLTSHYQYVVLCRYSVVNSQYNLLYLARVHDDIILILLFCWAY